MANLLNSMKALVAAVVTFAAPLVYDAIDDAAVDGSAWVRSLIAGGIAGALTWATPNRPLPE